MKNFIFKSALILALLSLSFGCSSDDSSTSNPEEIHCPPGYTGTNCDVQLTPNRIKVTKIRVKYFPNTNEGDNWDFNTAPDIFVELGVADGTEVITLYSSDYYEDVLSDGTYYDFIPSEPIYLLEPTDVHTVLLGDFDSGSANEFMGGFNFFPYSSNNEFPSVIKVEDLDIPLSFELSLRYEW